MKTFIDYNWLSIKSLWYKPQKPSIFCLPWWHFHFRSILIKQITIDMSPVPWNKVELHAFFIRNPFIRVSTWDLNKLRNKYLIFEILRNFRSSSYGAKKLKYLNFSSSKKQILYVENYENLKKEVIKCIILMNTLQDDILNHEVEPWSQVQLWIACVIMIVWTGYTMKVHVTLEHVVRF